MRAKLPITWCHRVPMFPIACTPCGKNRPSQGAIVCLYCLSAFATMCQGRLSHGSPVSQVGRLCVPSWPSHGAIACQVAHRKELSCAKLPIKRCHYVPSFTLQGSIACQVAHHKVNCVPSCPLQGAIACHVAHRIVPLRANVAHRKVPSCAILPIAMCHGAYVAHRMVPSCGKFIMSRCHHLAPLPIAWCHGRLSHGSPMCQVSHLIEPSCTYVPHLKVPSCAYVPYVMVPSCAFVTYCMCPFLCQMLSVTWGALPCAKGG